MRISTQVKSAACKALKWPSGEDTFSLKVPSTDDFKPLWVWLKSVKEPSAAYFTSKGVLVGLQWRLEAGQWRSLLKHVPNEVTDG